MKKLGKKRREDFEQVREKELEREKEENDRNNRKKELAPAVKSQVKDNYSVMNEKHQEKREEREKKNIENTCFEKNYKEELKVIKDNSNCRDLLMNRTDGKKQQKIRKMKNLFIIQETAKELCVKNLIQISIET